MDGGVLSGDLHSAGLSTESLSSEPYRSSFAASWLQRKVSGPPGEEKRARQNLMTLL